MCRPGHGSWRRAAQAGSRCSPWRQGEDARKGILGLTGRAVAAPCQLMHRVRLQTSTSASNSRAMNVVGNLDDNMGGFPVTYGPNVNLGEDQGSFGRLHLPKWLIWIKKLPDRRKKKAPRLRGRGQRIFSCAVLGASRAPQG